MTFLEHREAIRRAAANNKADSIALIGSVARGDDTEESDYDFVVRFAQGASLFDQAGLILELEDLLHSDVEVISAGGLKPYLAAFSTTPSCCEPGPGLRLEGRMGSTVLSLRSSVAFVCVQPLAAPAVSPVDEFGGWQQGDREGVDLTRFG